MDLQTAKDANRSLLLVARLSALACFALAAALLIASLVAPGHSGTQPAAKSVALSQKLTGSHL